MVDLSGCERLPEGNRQPNVPMGNPRFRQVGATASGVRHTQTISTMSHTCHLKRNENAGYLSSDFDFRCLGFTVGSVGFELRFWVFRLSGFFRNLGF